MQLEGRTIAVTGATGFLGRYLVEVLQERGAQVVGVVRRPERGADLERAGVELRRADLLDKDALTEAFRGCVAIISNAALFSIGNRDWAQHHDTNIEGASNVMHAARGAGVRRIIQISSTAVYRGRLLRSEPFDEESPMLGLEDRNAFNAYQVSKSLSEQLTWRLARQLHLHLSTLRPGPIYGAGDHNFTPLLKKLFSWPLVPLSDRFYLPFVYAGDVAEAAALALEHKASVGRAYNTTGEGRESLAEMAEIWRAAGGQVGGLPLTLPIPFRFAASIERARDELGYQPRSFAEGIEETFAREPSLRGG